MKGEKVFFRKKLFGGFNRDDVVTYIAKIAGERNEAIKAKESAEDEVRKLTRKLQIQQGETPLPLVNPQQQTEFEPEMDFALQQDATLSPEAELALTPQPDPIPEPDPTPDPTPEPEPDPEPEPEPEPTPEPFSEPSDYEAEEETADMEEATSIQPVDFGFVEETEAISPAVPEEEEQKPARIKVVKKIKRNN